MVRHDHGPHDSLEREPGHGPAMDAPAPAHADPARVVTFGVGGDGPIPVTMGDATRARLAGSIREEGHQYHDHSKVLRDFMRDVAAYSKSVDMTALERSRLLNALEAGRWACRNYSRNLYELANRYVLGPGFDELDDDETSLD